MKVTPGYTVFVDLPFSTLALCSITCRLVMSRRVLLAGASPLRTASSKLSEEAAVIVATFATAICAS
jgi:hypothetical protein